MNLVVNDQSPVFFVEDVEVFKAVVFGLFMRDHLIGGDRNGLNSLESAV